MPPLALFLILVTFSLGLDRRVHAAEQFLPVNPGGSLRYGFDTDNRPVLMEIHGGGWGGPEVKKVLGAPGLVFVPVLSNPSKIRLVDPKRVKVTAKELGLHYLHNFNEDPEEGKPLPVEYKPHHAPEPGDIGTFVTINPGAQLGKDFTIRTYADDGKLVIQSITLLHPSSVSLASPLEVAKGTEDSIFRCLLEHFMKK